MVGSDWMPTLEAAAAGPGLGAMSYPSGLDREGAAVVAEQFGVALDQVDGGAGRHPRHRLRERGDLRRPDRAIPTPSAQRYSPWPTAVHDIHQRYSDVAPPHTRA